MTEKQQTEPSQVAGQLKNAQGAMYNAVGSVLPASTGDQWAQDGTALQNQGQAEVQAAKDKAASDATVDAAKAKAKSTWGYVTGNQEMQSEGNVENEGAQWKYKQATSDKAVDIPVPSGEGVKGKIESVVGMVTGDQGKQMEGNMRAEKAAWKDGV
ncbi:uncharacterized protein CcaverHIS019_0204880 [Cutaneotrichosporon cavernicola]|uniref:CsbD-like domain-containing protein n=1 Tax=Cutaneotrichosporon cavernicola TaxID=279322 RepID=A0AA48I0Z8_9TREE|nr:uncharacterized protein CcaverHIS019_0204880 [Cutaneotrichosporon cavernicola]BEI89126.1 hypothetical protein CcaverHIS019_0204880 [Cutaneotrichosporon cavernicola]BEI96903.1 hypothetical protein CcaverHIS631_0204920 [Cutaneotrichosporon cavernicola]BEJ04675.1 hypothetical protein CcaverHIS641_0204920 [Cutaneotrichosporon cavernicola]